MQGNSSGSRGEEVVASLRQMFPKLDEAVVAVVVEGCQNNMEKALDQLLEINAEVDIEKATAKRRTAAVQAKRWRNPLPDSFLSIEGLDIDRAPDHHSFALAHSLRNEIFAQELKQYDEFRPFLECLSNAASDALEEQEAKVSL